MRTRDEYALNFYGLIAALGATALVLLIILVARLLIWPL